MLITMKTKKLIRSIVKGGMILTMPVWPIWIEIPTELIQKIYPNVGTKQEADHILNEEKKKLGIKKSVDLRVYENNELREVMCRGYARISPYNDGFIIGANMSDLDRILLRHELYHIHKGDCTKKAGETKQEDLNYLRVQNKQYPLGGHLNYFYLQEPKAKIYSITGVKF